MFSILKKLLNILTPSERRRAILLLVMILITALLDMVGVASIMPLMAVLADPQLIETNTTLAMAYERLGFTSSQSFLIFLGVIVFVAITVSTVFRTLTDYFQTRFAFMRGHSISVRLVKKYLYQPYTWFLDRNSADLGKNAMHEVLEVVSTAIQPFIQLVAKGVLVFVILVLLIVVDPWVALISGIGVSSVYFVIYMVMRKYLSRIGAIRYAATEKMWKVVSEVFGGIKEVKLGGLEQSYIRSFDEALLTTMKNKTFVRASSQIPKAIIEMLVFGGICGLLIFLTITKGTLASAIPILSLYVFACYRLIPAAQGVYASVAQLRFANTALNALHEEIITLTPKLTVDTCSASIRVKHDISLADVSFTYPNVQEPALVGLNLCIPSGGTIGLVGKTGSGKTTTVDLILGLLEPQQGHLEVDGVTIDATNRRQWQRVIGYVPQQIYLSDDTVASNIAFGLDQSEIDQDAVERAARLANLHDFVTELPKGYATAVGERGVRLSGGERQRIGIARALYRNPQVIVFDEATSALDSVTESVVMESVHNLRNEVTIILIAHRLTTVRECDQIYLMDHGRVAAKGTYDALAEGNETFKEMTGRVSD